MNRKEIIKEYKEKKQTGAVYKITNTVNGKYLIDHSPNLRSVHSHFQFALNVGNAFDLKLKKDWKEFGGEAFKLEILEELEQREDQSQAEFMEELKTLEQLLRANFDKADEY
jgi:hypothetical protein